MRIFYIALMGGGVFASSALFISPEINAKYHFVVVLSLIGGMVMLCRLLWNSRPIHMGLGALLASLFIAFVAARALFSDYCDVRTILPFVCGWLLFFLVYQQKDNLKGGTKILGLIAVAQALYGLHNFFPFADIKGSFDNPAGYAACLVFLLPFCYSNVRNQSGLAKKLWIVACCAIVICIALSKSRAGLVALFCMAILGTKFYCPKFRKVFLLVVPLLVFALYFIRPESADGRLLIWRNSLSLIHDHPLFGYGSNGFQGNYMLAQAAYFKQNPDDKWAILADNVTHPFNEWLALGVNCGVVSLFLLVLVIFATIKANKAHKLSEQKRMALLVLVGIAVSSCFSYPFRYAFTWVLCAWSLAICMKDEKVLFQLNGIRKNATLFMLTLATIFCLPLEWRLLRGEYEWRNAVKHHNLSKYENVKLGYHPHFLCSYAVELNQSGHFEKSNELLDLCKSGLNDSEIQLLLGMNYMALHQWNSVELSFLLASQMCPNRFAPLVGLMRLYAMSNRLPEAKAMAKMIVSKEIKVQSTRVMLFIDEAKRFLKYN